MAMCFRPVAVPCGLTAFLDGMDTQSIGIAAPFIIDSLHMPRALLGMVFSAAILGAMLGAFLVGSAADRFGRKRMLLLSILVFGIGTVATSMANSYDSLLLVRFLTGIGVGGAAPCFLTLASGYTPSKRRAAITSMLWAAFPLGGMAGGFLNSYLIGHHGWHAIFLFGGAAPLVLLLVLAWVLPESPSFLLDARRQARLVDVVAQVSAQAEEGQYTGPALQHQGTGNYRLRIHALRRTRAHIAV